MANVRSANSWYVNLASSAGGDDLNLSQVEITAVILTSGDSAAAHLVLIDPTTSATKLDLKAPTGQSVYLDLSRTPIVCPNGLRVSTLANSCVATIIGDLTGT